jgi:Protein ChrB, N-terminal
MPRESEHAAWLILAYRLPAEPGRLRSAVWRRLNAAGAVYLANSVAALPAAPAAERLFRRVRSDISRVGGSAQLLRADPVAGGADLIRLYNAARDNEYAQIIVGCDELLGMIGSWLSASQPSPADLAAGDRALARLALLDERARARDAFGARQADSAAAALAKCGEALDSVADADE